MSVCLADRCGLGHSAQLSSVWPDNDNDNDNDNNNDNNDDDDDDEVSGEWAATTVCCVLFL